MLPLFFYGTLRDAELRERVAGRPIMVTPAWLDGFRCVALAGRAYPMLVEARGRTVKGLLAHGVDQAVMARLFDYEGPEYRLDVISVRDAGGVSCQARLFMTHPGVAGRYHGEWRLEDWQRLHKRRTLSRLPLRR